MRGYASSTTRRERAAGSLDDRTSPQPTKYLVTPSLSTIGNRRSMSTSTAATASVASRDETDVEIQDTLAREHGNPMRFLRLDLHRQPKLLLAPSLNDRDAKVGNVLDRRYFEAARALVTAPPSARHYFVPIRKRRAHRHVQRASSVQLRLGPPFASRANRSRYHASWRPAGSSGISGNVFTTPALMF